jgi:hypothetical protein
MNNVISTKVAATILGIHVESLRRKIRKGELKPLPGSGRRFFIFSRQKIESMPKPRIGRPPKDQ